MRTFDCFTFNGELDMLEIRLNVLSEYVDYFVLCESEETFSGKEKPLYYYDNMSRFSNWNEKIIYVTAPKLITDNAFERAGFQKDYIRETLFKYNLRDHDLIYFGDVDEIWKPQEVGNEVYNLKQLNYSYYLNNRSSEEWIGTVVGRWKDIKENTLNHWRATHTNVLEDGGWHFTNMGGADMIRKKLESYDHQEFNRPDIKDYLELAMEFGQDYVGREVDWQGKPFLYWQDETELPEYVKINKQKYVHLFK